MYDKVYIKKTQFSVWVNIHWTHWTQNVLTMFFQELSGKEKEMLENEMKEKVAKRDTALEKAKQVKSQLKLWRMSWKHQKNNPLGLKRSKEALNISPLAEKEKQSRKSYPVCSSWNYCVLYLLIFMWNKKTHDSTGQNRKLTKKQKPWERNSIKQLTQWKGSRTIRRKKMECPTTQHRGMRKHKQQEKCASR